MRLKNFCISSFFLVGGIERAGLVLAAKYFMLRFPDYENAIILADTILMGTGVVSWIFLFGVFYPKSPEYSKTISPSLSDP